MTQDEKDRIDALLARYDDMQGDLSDIRRDVKATSACVSKLVGRFEEHAAHEEHWQDVVSDWMRTEPRRISDEVGLQVAACQERSLEEIREPLEEARKLQVRSLKAQAIGEWKTRKMTLLLSLAIVLGFAALTYLLIQQNLDHAAIVPPVIGTLLSILVILRGRLS